MHQEPTKQDLAGEESPQEKCAGSGLSAELCAHVPAVLLLLDAGGTIIEASREFSLRLPHELLGEKLESLLPDGGDDLAAAFAGAMRGERHSVDVEAPDGTWWGLALAPARPGRVAAVLTHATARVAERTALAESERTFRLIVEEIDEAIVIAQGGRLVFVNPSMERLAGRTRQELLASRFTEFIHPEDRDTVLDRHLRRLAGEDVLQSYDFRIVRPDGSLRWVMTSITRIDLWGAPASLSMLSDITERKRTEVALREAERRYRDLFENAPVAIFQALPEGRFTTVNPEYARIVGYDGPEEMCAGITDIAGQMYVDPADRTRYSELLKTQGAVSNFETQLKRCDGSRFWASMNSRAIRDENGEVVAFDGFLTDVSERKAAEEALRKAHEDLEVQVADRTKELQQANERLRELDRQKSAFVSNASHELRTPLTSVLGFAKLVQRTFQKHFAVPLSDDPKRQEKARVIIENLSIIEQEGRRLTALLNDLLDINKIEEGRLEWRDGPVEPALLLQEAARRAAPRFLEMPGVELDVRVASELPRLIVDQDRLHQVLFNLLDNAAKFTAQGDVVLSGTGVDAGWVEIRVTDHGPGIPEAEREHVFEKFYQTRCMESSGVKPKGTGLGLAICRQIVGHYGGTIHVESGPGGIGASFVVRLPGEGVFTRS